MSAGWVAGSVRARSMSRRGIGTAAAREIALHDDLATAIAALAGTAYGHDVEPGQDLDTAQRAVVRTTLWNLRVLAGWQPLRGVALLRVLAGAVEVENVLAHVEAMLGATPRQPYDLGALASAWPRVARATRPGDVRRVLEASVWGDPGGESPRDVALAMRTNLADRVMAVVPAATAWAAGDVALLVAREVILQGRELPAPAHLAARRVLGAAALAAETLADLRAALPCDAGSVLEGLDEPADLWRSEGAWWRKVGDDGRAMLRASRRGEDILLGTVAVLTADAWRVRSALEVASRGGHGIEVFDEMV